MTDRTSTSGSNGDSSLNVGKVAAPKDKSCPFCYQEFTASSLGRHLDLYIKEKNPKPADGVHNIEEIRKLRGGITRRQPRNSLPQREGSTPGGTPGVNGEVNGKRSPQSEACPRNENGGDAKSPTIRRPPVDLNVEDGKGYIRSSWHRASWQATGVINDIPPIALNGNSDKLDQEGNGVIADKRPVDNRKVVSKQVLAKSSLDQKQKMREALDNARAAELALREVLGSVRAANRRAKPSATPFDYDPLSLEFPALVVHCLPPPPTLNQVAPIPSSGCWSINPPDQMQYEALRTHFIDVFQAWRISRAITAPNNPDDLFTYHPEVARSAEEEADLNKAARDLENNVMSHLHSAFTYWSSMALITRADNWHLQLAKAVGQKEHSISLLKSEREQILQENAHLRAQVEHLSMCQQPREFQKMPPSTVAISSKAITELGKLATNGSGIGLNIGDKNETIDGLVKTAMSRWLSVVQMNRASPGMASQRSLDQLAEEGVRPQQTISQVQNRVRPGTAGNLDDDHDEGMDLDADADADADADGDADGDETFGVARSISIDRPLINGRAQEAPMAMMSTGYGNHDRINGNRSLGVEGRNGQNRVVL